MECNSRLGRSGRREEAARAEAAAQHEAEAADGDELQQPEDGLPS